MLPYGTRRRFFAKGKDSHETNKIANILKSLLETPSPTGCEQRIAALVRERLDGVAD